MRVRYFDNLEEEIDCDFRPHAKIEQISKSRESVHERLDLTPNLVQISMVAPNVDLKNISFINEHQKQHDGNAQNLVVIGNCEQHVLHGAFGKVQESAPWELDKFLTAMHSIL